METEAQSRGGYLPKVCSDACRAGLDPRSPQCRQVLVVFNRSSRGSWVGGVERMAPRKGCVKSDEAKFGQLSGRLSHEKGHGRTGRRCQTEGAACAKAPLSRLGITGDLQEADEDGTWSPRRSEARQEPGEAAGARP